MNKETNAVRWGILGTGTIARLFAEGLHELPDADLCAVGSRSRQSADAFAHAFDVRRAHASYAELVRDAEIDVVYVATPNHAHKDHAILALEHGKAVLCEKPLTTDAAEARALIDVARREERFCMEGMWMRFAPLVRELGRLVHEGTIGDIRMIEASLGFRFTSDARPLLFDPARGGGALLDLGVYPLSFAFHLLGQPTGVVSQATFGDTGVDEEATAVLTFPAERQASIKASLRAEVTNDAVIHGTEGMIRVHKPLYCPVSATLVRTRLPSTRRFLLRRRAETTIRRGRIGNGYAHEAIEVMRCLRDGERESPIMPLDESLAIMETIDEMRAQWMQGRARSES